MKKNILIAVIMTALALISSCQKVPSGRQKGVGYLSFSEFSLGLDEKVDTKATEANGNYTIQIIDAEGDVTVETTYAQVKNNDYKISVPAGEYTLVACSSADGVPVAEFESPVYGVSQDFSIEAGETKEIGELVCTLLQCKVTVAYSDEFMANVTGECTTSVEVTSGHPLEYKITQESSGYKYNQESGYFAIKDGAEDVTMTVIFSGSIGGKNVKQTKAFTGIKAKQWRQVKFVQKVSEQGEATFEIVINDLIGDASLNNVVDTEEDVMGVDPNAPKDDGGICLRLADDCDQIITYSDEDVVYDPEGNKINSTGVVNVPIKTELDLTDPNNPKPTMLIHFIADIPNGLAELDVLIESDNNEFIGAVSAATFGTMQIDLVNPQCSDIIFTVVPFPHGPEIKNEETVDFDLSNAQVAISNYPGNHLFTMSIVDNDGKTKTNKITMVVPEK